MSKREDSVIDSAQQEQQSLVLSRGMQGIIAYTKTKAGLSKVLADDHARRVLTTTMQTFISVDLHFETGMRAMGEVLHNLINKQSEEMQRKALAAICEAQGVAVIELDTKHPRMSFAAALFARFPDMQKQVKGGKDSYAAQRVSAYTTAYLNFVEEQKTGKKRGPKTPGPKSEKLRTAADLFLKMWNSCPKAEQEVLERIAQRCKIDYQGWIPKTK